MAKSVGLSRQDMDHPNLHEHINNQLFGDGTSTLQRPQTSQGSDATRSVAPAIVDKGSANPLGAHKPEFGSVASQNLGSNALETYSGGTNVGILTGRPLAGGAVGLASAAVLPVVGDVIGGVARNIYHETDHSPEAAQRAQSRIHK